MKVQTVIIDFFFKTLTYISCQIMEKYNSFSPNAGGLSTFCYVNWVHFFKAAHAFWAASSRFRALKQKEIINEGTTSDVMEHIHNRTYTELRYQVPLSPIAQLASA